MVLIFAAWGTGAFAQEVKELTPRNSWLKAGVNAGLPVGDVADYTSFVLGLELKGQLMETNHVGLGITTGYNHFFAKENFKSVGTIPLAGFLRLYPKAEGFFIGTDLGYSLVTQDNAKGGFYIKPQIGYHNYDWNVFGFYSHIFRDGNNGGNIAHTGLGVTYNLRFN